MQRNKINNNGSQMNHSSRRLRTTRVPQHETEHNSNEGNTEDADNKSKTCSN